MERKTDFVQFMKQLPDFDLSIVIPVCESIYECSLLSSSAIEYYERNGIEIIVVIDTQKKWQDIAGYIYSHPFIHWKVITDNGDMPWQSPVRAFNIGIRRATKQYVLVMLPGQEFQTDVIYVLREKLDSYFGYYAIGRVVSDDSLKENLSSFGCVMARKEYFELINGYSEQYARWGKEQEDLRNRLELAGIRRLFFPEAVALQKENIFLEEMPLNMLSRMLLPTAIKTGHLYEEYPVSVVYDWERHPFALYQCKEYLSSLKQYDLLSDDIFEQSYPLIALVPTYNESGRIADCIRSVEKYCDGIILLDDDSSDNTYQVVRSNKLLVKAKKERTQFDDRQNRNILLDIASFFKTEWFIFIDADERFDDRFVDLKVCMKRTDTDVVGVWIANLWDSPDTYRTDMEDTNPNSNNGFWFRWRMFRNKGRMQFRIGKTLHFNPVPYRKEKRSLVSKTLLLHVGYLEESKRKRKYNFYQQEDRYKILTYEDILCNRCRLSNVKDIKETDLGA